MDPNATVLAYTWIDDSATCEDWLGVPEDVFHSRAYTTMNGLRMAEAVTQGWPRLQPGAGRVHLLGHSHGAGVATVAALALQQAAKQDPALNVLGKFTLLDSPEDNDASISDNNPIEIDGANFNWLTAQMGIARQVTLPGTTAAGSATVTGISTSTLVAGMGVAAGDGAGDDGGLGSRATADYAERRGDGGRVEPGSRSRRRRARYSWTATSRIMEPPTTTSS